MPLCYIDGLGFHRSRLDEILAYYEASIRGIFGSEIDLAPDSPDGQWIGRLSQDVSDFIQVLEDTYNARSPSGAAGAQLARLVRLNGITKNPPAYSTGTVTASGTSGTVIPAGSRIANSTDATAIFETQEEATIEIGGTVDISVKATVTGAVPGDAGTLTVLMTVISGWDSVTNADDVTLGDDGETDGELRARRARSVAGPSQGIVDGLYAALADLDDVQDVSVRENPEDTTQTLADGGTLAAHAIEVVIEGGDDQEIADAIWLRKSAGVTLVGTTEQDVEDSQGVTHTMRFTRPDAVPVYVEVQSPTAIPSDQQTIIQNAIVARGKGELSLGTTTFPALKAGEDVAVSDIYQAIAVLAVTTIPGLKVGSILIDRSAFPASDADVVIDYDERASWVAGNVTFAVV